MAKERPKRRIVQPCLEYNRGLLHEEELALRKALYASLVDAKKGPGKCKTEAEPDVKLQNNYTSQTCVNNKVRAKRHKPAKEEALRNTSANSDSKACVTSNTTAVAADVAEPARRFSTEMKLELKKRHINLLKQSSKLVRSAIKKQKKMAMKSRQPLKGKLLKSRLSVKTKNGTGAVPGTKAKKESSLQPSECETVTKIKRKRKKSKFKKLAHGLESKTSETNKSLSLNEEQLCPSVEVKKKRRRRKKLSKCQRLDSTGNKDAVDVSSDSSSIKKPRKERAQIRSKRVIHAQRKFASSRPLTPSSLKLHQETFEIQTTRANTEDFLTFLCLRGQSPLPKDLEIFNSPCAPVSPLSSEDDDESSYICSPSPSQSQVLSPAPSSSQLDSSNMSTLSPASHVDSVAHSDKHALKAQAEFYQGMAGGTRAHSEDQKLYEPQLTDTDDDRCLSITPPLSLKNTSLPPSSLDANCSDVPLPRPLPMLLSGDSGSFSTTPSMAEHATLPPPPLIAPGGSTVAHSQQKCCSPPPLLYIPVAAQKVTHLHGPPELKRFPPASSTDKDSVTVTKTTCLETNIQKEDLSKNGGQPSNSQHKRVDDKVENSIPAPSVPSEDTIPMNMAQIQSTKMSSEPSRTFVSINDKSKHLPFSVMKAAEGLHLAGSPTRFQGMLEEFSHVIYRQPNPCVVTPDQNKAKRFKGYHSSTERSKVRPVTRPFDGFNETQFIKSHSPPLLRHIRNIRERDQQQAASPPQLTLVTPRNESPSFMAETTTNVNAHFNPRRPSPHQIYPSNVHVSKTALAGITSSKRSTPSPPKFTPVTPNVISSYLTNVQRDKTNLYTPSPPRLTSATPNLVCSNPFDTNTSWMPVLNRMPVRSNAGHPPYAYSTQRSNNIGGVTGYTASPLQNVTELRAPRTPAISSSLPLDAETSVRSHFQPTSDYFSRSRSSTPPRSLNVSQAGPLRPTVLARTAPASFTVPRTLLQRPLTSTEIIVPGRKDLVIQQHGIPFTQGESSVHYKNANQSEYNCRTPQHLVPHSIGLTQSSYSYPLTVENSSRHFQPQASTSVFSSNVSQVNSVASRNCLDAKVRGTVGSSPYSLTKSFDQQNISSRTDCAQGITTAEPTTLFHSEKGTKCASVTNISDSTKQNTLGVKRIGRPPGSKNKHKPANNTTTASGSNNQGSCTTVPIDLTERHNVNAFGKKRIGRPPGSKNKRKATGNVNVSNSPTDSGSTLERGLLYRRKSGKTRKLMELDCEDTISEREHTLHNTTKRPYSTDDAEGSSLSFSSMEKASSSNLRLPSSGSEEMSGTIPVFHPSEGEFKDPLRYLEAVVRQVEEQGLCVVVPPASWKPGFEEAVNLRFSTEYQLVHKLRDRFGPVEQKLACIKHHMEEQDISLSPMPQIGGYELDLPQFSSVVKLFGGIEKLNDRKSWTKVADMLRIPTAVQDRVGRLQNAYFKYLLPFDLLSEEKTESLAERVKSEKDLSQFSSKGPNKQICSSDKSCFQKGRSLSLVVYQRTARNIQEHFFKNVPTADEVESEFWKIVESGDRYTCVHRGAVDRDHQSCFPTNKGNSFIRSGWNLNVLPHLPSSVLRHFGSTPAITIPWVQVDMALSTSGWRTNPLNLCHVDYLHTGADKIWYSVPASQERQFITALSDCTGIQHPPGSTERRLDFTASLESLRENGISVNRVVQKLGQFVVTLPKAYHFTIGCGFSIAEAVAFAPRGWIRDGKQISDELSKTPQFYEASYEKLIIGAAEQLDNDDQDLTISVLDELARIRDKEITSRKQMLELGLTVTDSGHVNTGNEGKRGKRSLKNNTVQLCEECGRPCFFSAIVYEEDSSVYCHEDAITMIREQNSPDGFKIVTRYDMSKLDRVMGKLQGQLDKGSPQTLGDRETQGDLARL